MGVGGKKSEGWSGVGRAGLAEMKDERESTRRREGGLLTQPPRLGAMHAGGAIESGPVLPHRVGPRAPS
jgi:hypothetical protein